MGGVHGIKPLVVVDKAHLPDKEMFEEIRFMLNQKMGSKSPLALIIPGQIEIREKPPKQISTAVV